MLLHRLLFLCVCVCMFLKSDKRFIGRKCLINLYRHNSTEREREEVPWYVSGVLHACMVLKSVAENIVNWILISAATCCSLWFLRPFLLHNTYNYESSKPVSTIVNLPLFGSLNIQWQKRERERTFFFCFIIFRSVSIWLNPSDFTILSISFLSLFLSNNFPICYVNIATER